MKAGAPVGTGALRRSTKVRAGKRKKDYISYQVIVTGGHPQDVPAFIEYGTRAKDGSARIEANPFVLRAFEKEEPAATAGIVGAIVGAIEQAGWL